jgi:uncharacterized protein (TIGR00255 family)
VELKVRGATFFSMTGFGRGTAEGARARVHAEIRSVNARTLDVRVRADGDLASHALGAEQLVRRALSRGRVEVALRIEAVGGTLPFLDRARAQQVKAELDSLAEELGLQDRATLKQILVVPGVVREAAPTDDLAPLVELAVGSALRALLADRAREGDAQQRELCDRAKLALDHLDAIAEALHDAPQRLRARFLERLDVLAPELERPRVELEVALLVDRTDVSEEVTRARTHLAAFLDVCRADAVVSGRRLDFLLQEVLRETTTLSAKVQDAAVSQKAVEIRVELERLREQVQNVE